MKYFREIVKLSIVIVFSVFIVFHFIGDTSRSSQHQVYSIHFDIPDQEKVRFFTGRKKNKPKEDFKTLMNIDSVIEGSQKKIPSKYVKSLEEIRNPEVKLPKNIKPISDYIDVGFILINLKRTKRFSPNMEFKITRTFDTMITYSSGYLRPLICIF